MERVDKIFASEEVRFYLKEHSEDCLEMVTTEDIIRWNKHISEEKAEYIVSRIKARLAYTDKPTKMIFESFDEAEAVSFEEETTLKEDLWTVIGVTNPARGFRVVRTTEFVNSCIELAAKLSDEFTSDDAEAMKKKYNLTDDQAYMVCRYISGYEAERLLDLLFEN